MNITSKKTGVVYSYISIIASSLINLVLVPVSLHFLGADRYGLYEYVYSIAQYATILDFGLATIIIKNDADYKNKDIELRANFLANILLIALLFTFLLSLIGLLLFFNIDIVFSSRTHTELIIIKKIFLFMIAQIGVGLFQHYYDGILLSCERYAMDKKIVLVRVLMKLVLTIILLTLGCDIYSLVFSNLLSSVFCLSLSICIVKFSVKCRIKFLFFDFSLIKKSVLLSGALIVQSVATYLNNSLDKYVVGSFLTNSAVTIYAISIQLVEVLNNIATISNNIFLPELSSQIVQGANYDYQTEYVIKIGRFQCILCLGVFGGFIVFGRQFLQLWTGLDNIEMWLITLILMFATIIPLVESTCNSIMVIRGKQAVRSSVVLMIAISNLVFSIFLVNKFGIIGVAFGTFFAKFVGSWIVLNIYYNNVLHLNSFKMIYSIFNGILPCFIVTTIICIPFYFLNGNIFVFIIGVILFCIVYAFLLYLWGLNSFEKQLLSCSLTNIKKFFYKKFHAIFG